MSKTAVILRRFIITCVVSVLLLGLGACSKEEQSVALIADSHREITAHSGFAQALVVLANDWRVDYVRNSTTGEMLLDSSGKEMSLMTPGTSEVAGGWIGVRKTENSDSLSIWMKENFSKTPLSITIGLYANGQTDQIHITQYRGKSYKLVKKIVEEVEGSKKFIESTEGCIPITITNPSPDEKFLSISNIFKDVEGTSTFESADYGAFDWIDNEQQVLMMMQLMKDEAVVWHAPVPYAEGTTTTPYITEQGAESSHMLAVRPFGSVDLEGRMTYGERICRYEFTIQNEDTGYVFDVTGYWTQRVPLVSHTIIKRVY
ncbi:hypothetical protein [Sphingobacterium suaedae]|uniref:Uncharacterized protein n=1 Tax=Sphingobacterium suaedae TaxID=1686402 RepID=A0ABW5KPI2_9SPHI